MKLLPEYSTNIVVAAVHNGKMRWLVTEKEIWFLDSVAFAAAFSLGPSRPEREIADALEDGNPEPLLNSIAEYEVGIDELREWTGSDPESVDWDEWLPSLFVDFDNRLMINVFPEPSGTFHDYLPQGWHGEYSDQFDALEHRIPKAERYWENEPSSDHHGESQ